MMKAVWDFALVPIMVQEIRPRTIIEIGTAEGGSAAYYASVQRLHGLPPNVVTIDTPGSSRRIPIATSRDAVVARACSG